MFKFSLEVMIVIRLHLLYVLLVETEASKDVARPDYRTTIQQLCCRMRFSGHNDIADGLSNETASTSSSHGRITTLVDTFHVPREILSAPFIILIIRRRIRTIITTKKITSMRLNPRKTSSDVLIGGMKIKRFMNLSVNQYSNCQQIQLVVRPNFVVSCFQ